MSSDSINKKLYEQRIIKETISRLNERIDTNSLPLSTEDLQTLAQRSRQAFFGSVKQKERKERYIQHLIKHHDESSILEIVNHLEKINNEIGWEEK